MLQSRVTVIAESKPMNAILQDAYDWSDDDDEDDSFFDVHVDQRTSSKSNDGVSIRDGRSAPLAEVETWPCSTVRFASSNHCVEGSGHDDDGDDDDGAKSFDNGVDDGNRLLDALDALRKVVVENTAAHNRRSGSRRGRGKTSGSREEEKLKTRKEKVMVELRVVFLKIGEIDTLKEQYSADTFIQARWREPQLDGRTVEELATTDLDRFWNPLLYIDNILSETKEATWVTGKSNAHGEVYLTERRRVRGVFMENLELNDFPLDVQDLTVTVSSERTDAEIDIIPDDREMSAINVQTFVDQQEWRLHEHVEVSRRVMTQEYSSSNRCHPVLSVTCRAARRPGYFYWNVFLVMFFISALSFATFAVSPELPQNRLQLSFTLLLTSVAFKFVINQSLPKISYLTYMDKYVLLSLVILCVVCIWHASVTVFRKYGNRFVAELERDVFLAFASIYVLCHLVFIFWLYFDACKRRRLMHKKDREFQDFLARKKEWQGKCSARQSIVFIHPDHDV